MQDLRQELRELRFKLKDSTRVRDQWKKQSTLSTQKLREAEEKLKKLAQVCHRDPKSEIASSSLLDASRIWLSNYST